MGTAVAAAITGLLLSYEAVFQTRINYLADQIHIVATFAFLLSVVPHIGLIIIRDFKAIKDKKARESVTIAFTPLKRSSAGELAAKFDIVMGLTPVG